MKKFLFVMVASCFSFGFIRPAYGFFDLFSRSEDKECTEAKKYFTTASIEFLNALDQEIWALTNQTSNNLTQISTNCNFLEKKVHILKNAVSVVCNSKYSVKYSEKDKRGTGEEDSL